MCLVCGFQISRYNSDSLHGVWCSSLLKLELYEDRQTLPADAGAGVSSIPQLGALVRDAGQRCSSVWETGPFPSGRADEHSVAAMMLSQP